MSYLLEISGGTHESPAMSDGGASERTRSREAFCLDFAERVRTVTTVPLLITGGFRTRRAVLDALKRDGRNMLRRRRGA